MPFYFNSVLIPENVANAFMFNGVDITQVFFNNASVWLQILGATTGVFYSGATTAVTNIVTRINNSGTLIGSETNVGTARISAAGAGLGTTGVFYGGVNANTYYNRVTRINNSGTLIGAETNVGTARAYSAGVGLGTTGVFYAGYTSAAYNRVTRINNSGVLIGAETNVGTARYHLAGAGLGTTGVFYGGGGYLTYYNRVTRINNSGTLIGAETNVGTARVYIAGTGIGTTGVFYGGMSAINKVTTIYNRVTRINASGVLIGSETNVGTVRYGLAGAGL